MEKRFRKPSVKPGQLLVKFGQECGDKDLFYCWPENGEGMRRDCRILMKAFESTDVHEGRSLRKELEIRGYDITTLTFSIMKLPEKQRHGAGGLSG